MDAKHIAGGFGRRLATGIIAHSIAVEANLTNGPILPYPVGLEPSFRTIDPLQTFEQTGQQRVVEAVVPDEWVIRRLILPVMEAVDWRQAEALIAGLAGCNGPLSFEVVASRQRASFYLGAPPEEIEFLTGTWLAAFPDSAVAQVPDPWLGLTSEALALCDLFSPAPYHRCIRAAVSPWPQLLRLCTSLQDEHVLFCQIVFAPARHAWQQNIVSILEAERSLGTRAPHGRTTAASAKNLAEPMFAAVIRIGSTMPELANSIEAFTGSVTADGQPFRYRTMDDYRRVLSHDDVLRMLRCRSTNTTGQLLTSSELSRFVHPPDRGAGGTVRLTFLEGLPVPERLRLPGIPLGVNTNRGVPIPVFQPERQHNKSCWLIGASRMGKSSALIHKCRFLAEQGHGVGLLDPHRTTAFALLGALADIAPERLVFLNFDAATPVGYNPFDCADEEDYGRLTTEYVHSFKHLFDATGYHRMAHFLGMGIYALFVLKDNLATLPALFAKTPAGEHLRQRVIANVKNTAVGRFWQDDFHTHTADAFAPIINRLSALLLDDRTQRTFAQQENRVDIAQVMDTGKIVIVAPPASIDPAGIVGGMLIAQAKHAAFRRSGTPRADHHFHLIIDEFHRFITSANTLQSIIDEAAKGGLSVCLANQETGQIPGDLLKAMYSIPNIFVFGVNLPDAKQLAHLFNGHVTPETLAAQTTGDVYARIGQDIANFQCPPPFAESDADAAARIIAYSQAQYYATGPAAAPAPRSRTPRMIDTFPEDV